MTPEADTFNVRGRTGSWREPDYRLRATIAAGPLRVEDALCDLYLPRKVTDPIRLRFGLTRRQADVATAMPQFSIQGTSRDLVSGEPKVLIQADTAFPEHLSTKYWGFEISETILIADPVDLRVTNLLDTDSSVAQKVVGAFWLTPSLLLSPAKWIESSTTGEIKVQTVREVLFTLSSGLPLKFDTEFRHEKRTADETVTYSELVAAFESELGTPRDLDNILSEVDDLLMLTSFAERRRCICLGWEIRKPGSWTRYFRRNVGMPRGESYQDINAVLIDISQFESFLSQAYKTLVNSSHQDLLRQAVYGSILREGRTVESEYLTLYSALETVTLMFRKEKHLERVLSSADWAGVRRDLRRWMRRHPQLADKDKRRLIHGRIDELNRVSFAAAFGRFCDSYAVNLTDLWPVAEPAGGASLSTVRNKIVHGESFDRSQFEALGVARDHLQWVVERSILTVLGWPVEQSKVSPGFLRNFIHYEGWEKHRARLSSMSHHEVADSDTANP